MAPGPLSEFARMPTSRKVLVFAVVGLLLGGLYYRFVFSGLSERVSKAKEAYESTAGRHASAIQSLKKFGELRPEREKLLGELARDQAALPTEAEVPAFLETLERKVKESGVEIAKWQKRNEEPIETFMKVPVDIEITGTFMQIKRFFASLVQRNLGGDGDDRERIVSIESLAIAQPLVRDRQIFLNAKFTAVTYRLTSPKAAPAPLPPKQKGAASSAPAPGQAAPSSVKARVEGAMKQGGEARVQDETGSAKNEKGP